MAAVTYGAQLQCLVCLAVATPCTDGNLPPPRPLAYVGARSWNVSAFLDMGGYGAFIWPSYAASVIVLGLAVAFSILGHARAQAEIRRLEDQAKGGNS